MTKSYDLIVVGGGLSGGLTAYRAAQHQKNVLLIEQGATLGGNHTWSFHDTDLSPPLRSWLDPFVEKTWDGHQVFFDTYSRHLAGGYNSVGSEHFHRVLSKALGQRVWLGAEAICVDSHTVSVKGHGDVRAKQVVRATGFGTYEGPCAYQKFLGQELELTAPHGLGSPILMDARVDQVDGFRFFYVLPWSPTRLLVEDTYYSSSDVVDTQHLREQVQHYVSARGWAVAATVREEVGCLPIPLGGRAPECKDFALGVGAGLFHPTTGYSIPDAVRTAHSAVWSMSPQQWANECARQWDGRWFFRYLNRLLFCVPAADRVRFLRWFYRLPEPVIARFYSGSVRWSDAVTVLVRGGSPLPLRQTIGILLAQWKENYR